MPIFKVRIISLSIFCDFQYKNGESAPFFLHFDEKRRKMAKKADSFDGQQEQTAGPKFRVAWSGFPSFFCDFQ